MILIISYKRVTIKKFILFIQVLVDKMIQLTHDIK